MTTEERFWMKVDKRGADECWPWIGANVRGYGSFYVCGKNVVATRVAWEIYHGRPFPAGRDACHSCDNPPCCNPAHIWPGTKSENAIDSVRKGRQYVPAFHGHFVPPPRRSHCVRGHAMTPENARPRPSGGRECLTCKRLFGNAARNAARAARRAVSAFAEEESK